MRFAMRPGWRRGIAIDLVKVAIYALLGFLFFRWLGSPHDPRPHTPAAAPGPTRDEEDEAVSTTESTTPHRSRRPK